MSTAKNAVFVAILQVGVLVAGILVSGLWSPLLGREGAAHPPAAVLLSDYGLIGLGVPLAWILAFLLFERRPDTSRLLKDGLFWLGLLILVGAVVLVSKASWLPLLNMDWGIVGIQEE